MLDAASLLPSSASAPERALEMAMRVQPAVHDGVDGILTFKETPPDSVVLWLVWEYGLEALLPYLADGREAIAKGLPWSRIKGTPASVIEALSWLGLDAAVEEEEADSAHWPEYMIDPGEVPGPGARLPDAVALAGLSAPVGTILSRLYHGYDVRRFKLDGSAWGDLLSDYSGVTDDDMGVVLSFGRTTDSHATLGDDPLPGTALNRGHVTRHIYEDRVVWDFGRFGDVPVLNYGMMHSHLVQVRGGPIQITQVGADKRVIPKAAIALSDGAALGDTNACLFAIRVVEVGAPDPLSEGLALSGEPWRLIKTPIDERHDHGATSAADYLDTPTTGTAGLSAHTTAATSRRRWGHVTWGHVPWDSITINTRHTSNGDPA